MCYLKEIIRIISVKVHLHCEKCELDLRKKLLKHKSIYSVKTDMEAEILTIKGTIEPEKLLTYIRKKVNKHAEIIDSKTVKKKEKEKEEEEEKKEKKEEEKVEEIFTEKIKIIEIEEEVKVEVKGKEGEAPYFIHYVYAPQYFSDENPNACIVM
ncbi:hypothetical protein SLEP1_g6021 [Rubroshorea leprosula]|uniref:HMA domain-containing protein n=1 Tax=Rubroshorea leprosula TaxID=152421 RepID=A0AAV5HTU8_9ROSI|nr:hypothetical protein SLEP1_g6021 [Rubroshorea leprosula]